jgi:hypothetical protein
MTERKQLAWLKSTQNPLQQARRMPYGIKSIEQIRAEKRRDPGLNPNNNAPLARSRRMARNRSKSLSKKFK